MFAMRTLFTVSAGSSARKIADAESNQRAWEAAEGALESPDTGGPASTMNAETTSNATAWLPNSAPRANVSTTGSDDAIRLESCRSLDWILVKTRSSVYELVVLAGDVGEVMIRGGRFFPEFRRAIVVGSTFGGSGVKVRAICVGLRLELSVDGKRVVTSQIQAAWDSRFEAPDGRA